MITIEDIVGMTDLSEEEILAVAEHEHIPEAAAAALADYMMHQPKGPEAVRDMIIDDIHKCVAENRKEDARHLIMALHHFVTENPDFLRKKT